MRKLTDQMPALGAEIEMNARCADCRGSCYRRTNGGFTCLGCGLPVVLEGRSAYFWASRQWGPLPPQRPREASPARPAAVSA